MGAETQGGAGTAGEAREDKSRDLSPRFQPSGAGWGPGRRPHALPPSAPSAQGQALAEAVRGLETLGTAPTETASEGRQLRRLGRELELPEGRGEEAVIAYLGDEADSKVSNSE